VLTSFTLLILPLIYRVLSLYHTRETHVVQELPHSGLAALNTLAPMQTLIGFVATAFLAALLRKVKLPGRDCFPAILLSPLLALVPASILYGVSLATPLHLVIPRYFTVVAPGSALTWGLLTSRIDSRVLRQIFCVGLVAVTVFECFSSPNSRKHEVNFKQAHEFVNANVAKDKAPVLVCSAFIEADFEPPPNDRTSENALNSQLTYYPINASVVFLPMSLNDEAMRIGKQAVATELERHQRFLVIAAPTSYQTVEWLANYSTGAFSARPIRTFDNEIVVVEFRPVAESN